jgi:flagellar biosynthesis protein FlhF
MRIKKFVGTTIKEASAHMRHELGPNAIILGTRNVHKGGVLNFLSGKAIEITAAVDEPVADRENQTGQMRGAGPERNKHQSSSQHENVQENLATIARDFRLARKQSEELGDTVVQKHRLANIEELRGEMSDMKSVLSDISQHLKYSHMPALPELLKEKYVSLVKQDVEQKLAADVIQSVYGSLGNAHAQDEKVAEQSIIKSLASLVSTPPIITKHKSPRVVALVGPTGVGKTTTIAKLAAISKLVDGLPVALITADTYRIGAKEQLKAFATIADIPMEVVYKPSEMATAIKKFRRSAIIFIDTVGRSQKAKKDLLDLKRYLEAANPDETHLVLSASTAMSTLHDIVERCQTLRPNRIIFSKLDEAATLGNLLNVVSRWKLPVSYITTGQNVPDDIQKVEPILFASRVYNGVLEHA